MTESWRSSLRVACVVVSIAAGLALSIVVDSSVSAQPPAGATELKQLQDRAKALGPTPSDADWKKMTDAFDAWAKKYGAQTSKQERARAPQAGISGCPRTVEGPPGYYCYYASSDRGKCYYTCVKL